MSFGDVLNRQSSDPTSLLKSELNQQAAQINNQIRNFSSRIVEFNKNLNSRKLDNEQIRSEQQNLKQQSIQCLGAIKDLQELKTQGPAQQREKKQIIDKLYKSLGENWKKLQQIQENRAQQIPVQSEAPNATQPAYISQQQVQVNGYNVEFQIDADRNKQIRNIEQTMTDIAAIIDECGEEVHIQGETIDRIENHMSNAATDTGQGVDELQTAVKHQKTGGKCLWVVLIIVVVVVTAVLIILFTT